MSIANTDQVLELARSNFKVYIKAMAPAYRFGAMHHYLCEVLEKAVRREPGYTRIAISMPPRHGKSFTISELFPGYAMGYSQTQGVTEHIMQVGYAASLANDFGFSVRTYCRSLTYNAIFPEASMYGDVGTGGAMFRFPHGGTYRSFGVDGAITGKPATILIVDDPIKNRAQADSPTYIRKLQEGFGPNTYSRLEPNAVCIIVHTRWNEQDLIGYVLDKYSADKWLYIRLPALADDPQDPLGREIGEPLVPFRYDREALLKIKANTILRDWMALYQNDPVAASSSFWQPTYLNKCEVMPRAIMSMVYVAWDCANELSSTADYTAYSVWTLHEDKLRCVYADRRKVEINDLIQWVLDVQEEWNPSLHLIEKAQNGVALGQYLSRNHSSVVTEYWPAHTNKQLEFNLISIEFEKGVVEFQEDFPGEMGQLVKELSQWPGVKNDDLAITALMAIRWYQENKDTTSNYLVKRETSSFKPLVFPRAKTRRKFGESGSRGVV